MNTKSDSRELRVFVSSTFRDLIREREYLVKMVFPEIRHLCRARGIVFTEIDLRWGLTNEDSSFGRVISTCLQEIDRCRPLFIGILGDRYGWIPDLRDIHKSAVLMEEHSWLEEAVLDGISLVEMEFNYAVLNAEVPMPGSFFYLREGASTKPDDPTTDPNASNPNEVQSQKLDQQKFSRLKARVLESGRPVHYFNDPEALGKLVRKDLLRAIKELWPEEREATPLELERREHETFAIARRQAYIARQDSIQRLSDHVKSDAQPLVVYAESGLGKSALLAYWSRFFGKRNPDLTVVTHFVGSVVTDTGAEGLLRRIFAEVKELTGTTDPIPSSPLEMQRELVNWLAQVPENTLVIVIDSLNQLDARAAELEWLPTFIPPTVRIIISTTPGVTLDALRKRGWPEYELRPFENEDRKALITRFLSEYRKSLTLEQVSRIASDPKSASPLFVRTLLEELRLSGSHESIDRRINRYLGAKDMGDLFRIVLMQMEEDFGESIIREIMTLIWSARQGLTEHELLELTPLTRAQLSQTMFALEYHLTERQGIITFFHDYLRRAVEEHYLSTASKQQLAHERLAEYFEQHQLSPRKAYEYPWQLRLAEDWVGLKEYLTNIPTFLAYCTEETQYDYVGYWLSLKGMFDLSKSYEEALQKYKLKSITSGSYLEALIRVAKFLSTSGEFASSERMFREALEMVEATHGASASETADVLEELGKVLEIQADYKQAAEIFERAISIREESGGMGSERLASTLDSFATLLYHLGNYQEAEAMLRRAVAINEQLLGPLHAQTLNSLGNLGVMFHATNRLDEAEATFTQVLTGLKNVVGADSPSYTSNLSNLGAVALAKGNFPLAIHNFREALSTNERILGPEHPETAVNVQNLGTALRNAGDKEGAVRMYDRSLAITRKVHGDQHPETAKNLRNVAGYYYRLGDLETANRLHTESYSILRRVLGEEHDTTTVAHLLLAQVLSRQGKDEEAIAIFETTLALVEGRTIPMLPLSDHRDFYREYIDALSRAGNIEKKDQVEKKLRELEERSEAV